MMNQHLSRRIEVDEQSGTIGQWLLDRGRLTPSQAEKVLRLQRESGLRFGEAALSLGFVAQSDIDQALAIQFAFPYFSADDLSFSAKLFAAFRPFSAEVEALRNLRSQLLLRWFGQGHKALAIAQPNQASLDRCLAANLAIVFSQLGERTLLIDANLRRETRSDLFGQAGQPGLSELLSQRAGIEVITRLDELCDLSVLESGALPPNPQELLSRSGFEGLLRALSEQYQVIIVDTPAFDRASDVLLVAARAGGTLLSVEADATALEGLTLLCDALQQLGSEVLGSVLHR
ncbi:chain length determinant protein tyrosine kinase EpsG [Paludibacterium purpuratum]|uniref:Chain length determinant protein tyrosine kinase EpsG n=1 Tax=Paludibacterium purpuratum TaxID=1144873 RepID=A0A4R7B4Q4_9NEIS|nr:chain length determinant protein tyrosine kinase EpsG [Paludibacterium purpuratum]TDR77820.1 chain length determinant protein tyrosine kinase EpsG [Paludibacterium purpuratum]